MKAVAPSATGTSICRSAGWRLRPLHIRNTPPGDLMRIEQCRSLRATQRRQHGGDDGGEFRAVLQAIRIGGKARVVRQCRLPQHARTEAPPLRRLLDRHDHLAIPAAERRVGIDRGMRHAVARRLPPRTRPVEQRHAHPVGHAVEHRDLDRLPRPVRPRAISASRIAAWAFMPVAMSATETPTLAGALGRARDGTDPAFGLHQHVVGAHVAISRVLTVAGDVDGDQAREVVRRATCGIKAQRLRAPGDEVLHEHIRAAPPSRRSEVARSAVVLEVENRALLAAVEPDEIGARPAMSVLS